MALKLYNPRTQTFVSLTLPVNDLPLVELLLINLLIEMQTLTQVINAQTPGGDDVADIRTDIASVI